jgi:glycosyltransferase involved in cell wall biosynthesis
MNILWHLRPRYDSSETSGANLRFFNLTRELINRGHRVYFLLDSYSSSDDGERHAFVERVTRDFGLAGLFQLDCDSPRPRRNIVHKITHSTPGSLVMRSSRLFEKVAEIVREHRIDVYMSSVRGSLWLASDLRKEAVTAVDWCDSEALAFGRELKLRWHTRSFRGMPGLLKGLLRAGIQEAYYGRCADVNLVVSPVDKSCIDRLARKPKKTHLIYNGVNVASRVAPKNRGHLIFSGRMDFPPNYNAALWFIDRVLPLILEKEPAVKLTIAGPDPIHELRSRANEHISISGFVENLASEIASSELYIAPLVSGSGFKNKVVEALGNGTYVAGTSMAVEFLPPELRSVLLVGDAPQDLAGKIIGFLRSPETFDGALERARQMTRQYFQWGSQTERLLNVFRVALDCKNEIRSSSQPALLRKA